MKKQCNFCGRNENEVKLLITGVNGYICEDCAKQAYQIVKESGYDGAPVKKGKDKQGMRRVPKPHELKAYLDQYVIGQEDAKRFLSVAVYNHYKRLEQPKDDKEGVEIEKSNIIMVGPTGTGKTLMARVIARQLDVPFTIVDATIFTEAGYVGEDVESILSRLLQVADYNVEATERGIVFIDEVDKIARKGDNPSITRDIKEGVQQALLKLLEGSVVNVPPQGGRKHPDQEYVHVDTSNILFICGGAFDGIERKIAQRMNAHTVGYNSVQNVRRIDKDDLLKYVQPQDLKSFGLIPEIIGRLPILTHLDALDRTALRRILVEPKNSIVKQYKKLFSMDGIDLTFTDEALDTIVDKAVEYKLGARGLRSIVESIMMDAMFDLPSQKIRRFEVTADYVNTQLGKTHME